MEITREQLIDCGVSPAKATTYAPIITMWSSNFGITTPMRMCHFLAQVLWESGCFRYTKELASGTAYEGRKDLGNTQKGDGVRYKGRGLIQITGRNNYYNVGKYFGMDFIKHPELLETPEWAFKSAGWFWMKHGCNVLADQDALTKITKIINGGYSHKADRLMYLGKAKRAYKLLK